MATAPLATLLKVATPTTPLAPARLTDILSTPATNPPARSKPAPIPTKLLA